MERLVFLKKCLGMGWNHRALRWRGATMIAALIALYGCASSPIDDPSGRQRTPAQLWEPAQGWSLTSACPELIGVVVPASVIGLPTRGARVVSTEVATTPSTSAVPLPTDYCKVLVEIDSVDSSAPSIGLQLNLPANWNTKFFMFGGAGYNGAILEPARSFPAGAANVLSPLARGYATANSDSGHKAVGKYAGALASLDGSFAVNDEALRNYGGDFIKKSRDVAQILLREFYATEPVRAYFAGGSTGGREALVAVQKWPADWDGAISLYPAVTASSLILQFGRITRAMAAPGAYPTVEKRRVLYEATLKACDGHDGAVDGIISHVSACQFRVQDLRCSEGTDTGDTCLSDAQIDAFMAYATPIKFPYKVASGETGFPESPVLAGADTAGSDAFTTLLALNTAAPAHPATLDMPYMSQFWDQWVRFFVTRDPAFNALTFDPLNPGVHLSRVSELTAIQDANKADLKTFRRRGGKLLLAHGLADPLITHLSTRQYFARLNATMTSEAVREFVRYYEIPGYGHIGGTAFNAGWDSLTALENWVEQGISPRDQVVVDKNARTRGRSRPLCEYPSWPQYSGKGNINDASSFTCTSTTEADKVS